MLVDVLDTSARLLRLLTVLQTRRFWSGAELAERLEITDRTLRRDVDRLRSLGYAIEATSGPGGGYQLGRGRDMPPLIVDDDEAVAIAVALRTAMDAFAGLGETAMRLFVKLDQLLPARVRKRVQALPAATMSLVGRDPSLRADTLATLATACRDGVLAEFGYRSHEGAQTQRTVEPVRLVHSGNRRWYLVAWDRARETWRTFRADRVLDPIRLGARVPPRKPPADFEQWVSKAIASAPYSVQAQVLLRGSKEELLERFPPWQGALEDAGDGWMRLTIGAPRLDSLVALLVLAGVELEVLEPPELAEHLRVVGARLVAAGKRPRRKR